MDWVVTYPFKKINLNSILLPALGILTVGMPDVQSVDDEDVDDTFSHHSLYELMLWLFLLGNFSTVRLIV